MTAPKRIQRKRVKGWRMPEGAVYVGRGSRWGNPFKVKWVAYFGEWWVEDPTDDGALGGGLLFSGSGPDSQALAHITAASLFRDHTGPLGLFEYDQDDLALLSERLAGRDLACWCPEDLACHADVLLELANQETH